MALKDIISLGVEFNHSGATFKVRGLSLADLVVLLEGHKDEVQALFEPDIDFTKIVLASPDFIAKLISLAADEPDAVNVCKRLPIGLQVQILNAIWAETALEVDNLGKLLTGLMSLMKEVNKKFMGGSDLKGTS